MKLSVIIPLYNNARYLQTCFDALGVQGIDRSSYEVIVVDDGSMDDGGILADEIAGKWDNVSVIHQENRGSGVARNVGMDIAKGEYIHFVDPDDQVMPGAYKYLFDRILQTSPDLVYFDFGNDIYTEDGVCEGCITYSGSIRDYVRANHIRPYSWMKLYRRQYLMKNNIRFPSLRTRQDIPFTWDMMRYDGTMVVTDAKLYSYTTNPQGASYRRDVEHVKRTVNDLVVVNEKLKEYSRDFEGVLSARNVRSFNYHLLFNRILCTPYSYKEIKILFPRCAKIGINHLNGRKILWPIDFLYHHPAVYYIFQYLIMKLYFSKIKNPPTDEGNFIKRRLKETKRKKRYEIK